MGWNSTLVVLNDELHRIEQDALFGQKVAAAVKDKFGNKDRVRINPGAEVVATHNADEISLIAVGGNYASVLHLVYGPHSHHHKEEGQILLLKELADKFGFNLVPKYNPENKRSRRK